MTSVETQHRDRGLGAPAEQRREFTRAFMEQGWARPGLDRPTAKPHVTMVVATVALLGALLGGVLMQLIKPVKLEPAKGAAPAAPTAGPSYTAVAGWDCAAADDHGFIASGRGPTWLTIGQGGWSKDGCHGDYVAIPFAGTGARAAAPATAQWWFRPATEMRSCTVEVFVPAPDRAAYRPVSRAAYSVLNEPGGAEFARFEVRQDAAAGGWVTGGTWLVGRSGITVRLSAEGDPPAKQAMLAVAHVRVSCTG
ncbi:hypothetical protein [Micromonospora rubida]|uniref:hypothetical protein n=1 Tax=Micromonospora rubida TaxID=2697657 RepID=UPI0013781EC1|nr:hypothetical protein [Micromonospora rubida]NBE80101.1 hypothetical protein [Micromonospora rubida]